MLFNREWFLKHQKLLLWFANTRLGKYILCINRDSSSVGQKRIIHIEPNAIWWKSRGKKITAEFRTHDKFGKRLYYAFKPIWHLLHYWDMFFANNWVPTLNLGFDTTTFYPAAGANSPVDGFVLRNGVDESFATIRAGAGTAANVTDPYNSIVFIQGSTSTDKLQGMWRAIFCFGTNSLGAGAVVSAATLSLYGVSGTKVANLGTVAIHVAGATPASTSNLATSDYENVQRTSFSNIAWASLNDNAYNDWSLNASGVANISVAAVSKFSLQSEWDLTNTAGYTWSSNAYTDFNVYYADRTGTANDPKLLVTYTPAPQTSGGGFLLNFI